VNLSLDLQALKAEADRRIAEWATTGRALVCSSLYDACARFLIGEKAAELIARDHDLTLRRFVGAEA